MSCVFLKGKVRSGESRREKRRENLLQYHLGLEWNSFSSNSRSVLHMEIDQQKKCWKRRKHQGVYSFDDTLLWSDSQKRRTTTRKQNKKRQRKHSHRERAKWRNEMGKEKWKKGTIKEWTTNKTRACAHTHSPLNVKSYWDCGVPVN